MADGEETEEIRIRLRKLLVRLNVKEGKEVGTLVQIIQDLLFLSYTDHCVEIFADQNAHVPLMMVLSSHPSVKVQQLGWSLLCRLMEICPSSRDSLTSQTDLDHIEVHRQILKVLSQFPNNPKMVMVGLRALGLLLQSDEMLVKILDEEDVDVFFLVLEAMRAFSTSEEVQLQGCAALTPMLENVSVDLLVEFVEKKDHEVILNALETFMDCETVVLPALRVLTAVAAAACNVEMLMSKAVRCYSVVCRAMKQLSSSEAVQEAGCALLLKFTCSESYYNILVPYGAHKVAIKACLSYPDNAAIQTATLLCLSQLTASIVQNQKLEEPWTEEGGGEKPLVQAGDPGLSEMLGWSEACYSALETHAEDPGVQEAACLALNSLLLHGDKLHHVDLEERPLHSLVMASMLLHSSSVEVFQATSCLLRSLIRLDGTMQTLLLSHGVHFNLVDMMRRHAHSSDVCTSACKLLHTLFQGVKAGLEDSSLLLGQILNALQTHDLCVDVQLEGLRASLVLLSPDIVLNERGISVRDPGHLDVPLQVLKNQCLVEGAHTIFLVALNRFISSEKIQACGLAALSVLADCSGAVDLMCQQGAMDTALHTLQTHPHHRDIHYWGLSLLFRLICKNKLSVMAVRVLASVLVSSLRQHKQDDVLLLKGFQVLWKLLDSCSSATPLLQKEAFGRDLFETLHNTLNGRLQDPLHKVCCMCLANMVVEGETLSELLETACEDEDVTMAECLILLGADIHKKTKNHSLLYKVCNGGACLPLLELLVWAGVDEQLLRGALSLCVSRGDDPAVIFLLHYFGFYHSRSALCLSGLRLGQIEAKWLVSLLTKGKTLPQARSTNSKGQSLARTILELQKKQGILDISTLHSETSSDASFTGQDSVQRSDERHTSNEPVRLLDLSCNQLQTLSSLVDHSSLKQQMQRLFRLDLSSNRLSEFPSVLCKSLQSLTHLDLQGNQLQSLPLDLLTLPALSVLNVSRNSIGPSLHLDTALCSPSIRQLDLSFNQITSFPFMLSRAMEKLEELSLEGNHMSELSPPLFLTELKVLDISKNQVKMVSDEFLRKCVNLETFNASVNQLSLLSHLPTKLTTIKLAQNKFTAVPAAIICLPYLRSVDMRNNSVKVLPGPDVWLSVNLRELLFSHNHIAALDLSGNVHKWIRLEKLHLSHNKLTEIPPPIGLLEDLQSLDLSHNKGLHCLPDEMGKLVRLWDLPLDGLPLQLDFKHIGNRTKDLIRFFHQRLSKAVPYHRVKLVVVGSPSSGKSSLIRQLMGLKQSEGGPDDRVSVRDWVVKLKGKERRNVLLNVWELPGGEECGGLHPHFFSSRAIYLVLYDLRKGSCQLNAIKPWLFTIKSVASRSPVMVVGTHADACEERYLQEQAAALSQAGLAAVKETHMLCAREDPDAIRRLRAAIFTQLVQFQGQLVPGCYVDLERRVLQERSRAPADFPVLPHHTLLQLLQETTPPLEEAELPQAVHFLREAGVLLHFSDPIFQLTDFYFIDPQWLFNLISQTLKSSCQWDGVGGLVPRSTITTFMEKCPNVSPDHKSLYFKLLEMFQIALPFADNHVLLPSRLSDHRPVIDLPHCENSEMIVRLYEMPYFPMGYWSRLIRHLLDVSPTLLSDGDKDLKLRQVYWKRGVCLRWSAEVYCLIQAVTLHQKPSSVMRLTVPCSRQGRQLFGQVVDHVDSVLEEWFPQLTSEVQGSGETLLKKWAVYRLGPQTSHTTLLEDLLGRIKGGLPVNPDDPRATPSILQISPDLTLSDLWSCTMLGPDHPELELSEHNLLGNGAFGCVYKAEYRDEEVAVKIFKKHLSTLCVNRLVRQELTVLGRLCHPSVVGLLAAGCDPYVLVMELAPCGSLDSLFERRGGRVSRKLQHRIALHVADGLRYLHSSLIIYRDLKPHNILLFNLKTNADVIAKITDFGISQYCCSNGVRASVGTPGFRAPEVAKGNAIYNVQADVYSLGLFLYDLLTCGKRIADGVKFPSEFDEAAVQGRLPDPVKNYDCSPWPKFECLMRECLRLKPQDRPTSAQVFDRLNSAELLCLMREQTLPRFSSRCFAVSSADGGRSVGGDGHVWIGGGSDHQKLGWVTLLNVDTGRALNKELDSSPVVCMVTFTLPGLCCEWLIVGTQSGSLYVIDTRNFEILHSLRSVSSVTSLYFHTNLQHRSFKNYLLVGTADGGLVVYEDSVLGLKDGGPVKRLQAGDVSSPLICLGTSSHPHERGTLWAACGTRVFSLTCDFDIGISIDTKSKERNFADAGVQQLAVDKHMYVSKAGGTTVEVWDKKTKRIVNLIECAQLLRSRSPTESLAVIKSLFVQHSCTLWIGTEAGLILLVEISSGQLLKSVGPHCDGLGCMAPVWLDTLDQKNCVLVLGTRRKQDRSKTDTAPHEEVLLLWKSSLALEMGDLLRHCELRDAITRKMRRKQHN